MAMVDVKNRDGSKSKTINTNDYVFNNCIKTVDKHSFDKNIFPYVKIDGEYYVNDGAAFDCQEPDKCATMIHKLNAFTKKEKDIDVDYIQYFKEFSTFMTAIDKETIEANPKENEIFTQGTGFPGVSRIAVPYYYIDDIKVNAWGYDSPDGKDTFFLGGRGINRSPLKFGFGPKFDYTWYDNNFTTRDDLEISYKNGTLLIGNKTYSVEPNKFAVVVFSRESTNIKGPDRS